MTASQADGYTDPPYDGSMTIEDWLAAGRIADAAAKVRPKVSLPLGTYRTHFPMYPIGDDILGAAIAEAREKQQADLSVLLWGVACVVLLLVLLGVIP